MKKFKLKKYDDNDPLKRVERPVRKREDLTNLISNFKKENKVIGQLKGANYTPIQP